MWPPPRKHQYDLVPWSPASLTSESPEPRRRCRFVIIALLAAITLISSFGTGFLSANILNSRTHSHTTLGKVPLPSIQKTFHYNTTFAAPPNPETLQAWNALLPKGSGFIQHPTLSPEPSSIAAFHQLHCVNMLWLAYYHKTATDTRTACTSLSSPDCDWNSDLGIDAAEQEVIFHPGHAKHCFDYLRQSIMCAADSNLEPADKELGGVVTGWGSQRVCRDFGALVEWAERFRDGDKEGIL